MSDITYEHIKAIAKLENDVKERDATIKQLKGDIDHNVRRALEIAEENQRLKEALNKIAYPIKHLQIEAEKQGAQLDGRMANQLANDSYYLQGIAQKVLNP